MGKDDNEDKPGTKDKPKDPRDNLRTSMQQKGYTQLISV